MQFDHVISNVQQFKQLNVTDGVNFVVVMPVNPQFSMSGLWQFSNSSTPKFELTSNLNNFNPNSFQSAQDVQHLSIKSTDQMIIAIGNLTLANNVTCCT